MKPHRILFTMAGICLIAGGVYLLYEVMNDPEPVTPRARKAERPTDKPGIAAKKAATTATPATDDIILPNEIREAPSEHNNGRTFIRRSTSPDLLPDGSPRPKPFQARSEPAKNHALFVGVETEEMAFRVDSVNGAYLRGDYQTAIDDALELIEEIPENQQLKRLLIRSACLAKQPDLARAWLPKVSESDQAYMRKHCWTYGSPLD